MASAQCPTFASEATEATVDYFTAYWPEGASDGHADTLAREYHGKAERAGFKERARSQRGVLWFERGGVALGVRGEERWIRAHGPDADAAFGRSEATCAHYSRIDLAVTARTERPEAAYATRVYEHFAGLPRAAGQPRSGQLIADTKGGNTCYIGSRTSDCYIRVYDWGAAHDTADPGTAWRFEVETKGRVAAAVRPLLRNEDTRAAAIAGYVRAAMLDRRLAAPWEAELARAVRAPRQKSGIEEKLAWFESQVAPSVGTLIDAGYIQAVVESLGLAPWVQINQPI